MKAAMILSLASLALGSVLEQRACAGNNCNRQVTGTREGLLPITSRQADCSSFQLTTVTPSPTYVPPGPSCPEDARSKPARGGYVHGKARQEEESAVSEAARCQRVLGKDTGIRRRGIV